LIGKKKVAFLAVFSLAFALVLSNFVALSAAAPAANMLPASTGPVPAAAEDWTATEVVSTESTGASMYQSVAVGPDGAVHVAWNDFTDYGGSGTDADVLYKRFEPGSGWTAAEVVSTESTADSYDPFVGVDSDGTVHIAWSDVTDYDGAGTDWDIFYKRFVPGSGWTATEVVSTVSTGSSTWPFLAVGSDGKVHITWMDYTDYDGAGTDQDIFYRSFVPGYGWTVTEVVSTQSGDSSEFASLGVGPDGKVHIAWQDYTDYYGAGTDSDIFYKRFEPGSGWTLTEVVSTESTDDSYNPILAVDPDGKVHIAWQDETDYYGAGTDSDIFYKRFEPGSGWTLTEVVSTESTDDSYNPILAVDPDGKVHIAWADVTDYDGAGTDRDIFYKRFEPGVGFTTTEVVSTESTGTSYNPFVGVGSDGKVHVAWADYTNYGGSSPDPDIFYKRLELGAGWTMTEVVSTESTGYSEFPALAVGPDGAVHVAWEDLTDYYGCGTDRDIFYKRLELPEPRPPMPTYQYHFRLNPYIDVFHLNISDGGWMEGIVTTPSYTVPLLGKYEIGYAVIAWDLPAGGIEMGFAAIKASSGAGSMVRIMDDLSVVGPETVWLTWVSAEANVAALAGATMDDGAGSLASMASMANEDSMLEFVMSPFDDVVMLSMELDPWLWGWAEAVGPSYPAPILGVYGYGRFFYAMDFVDGTGAYELLFAAGSTCNLRGSIVRWPVGFSADPTPIWLTC